ncbi:MAG: hypothetical protein ACRC7G_07380 [Beijerinckiaceae bacterium]
MSTGTLVIAQFVAFFGLLTAFCLHQLADVKKVQKASERRSSDEAQLSP